VKFKNLGHFIHLSLIGGMSAFLGGMSAFSLVPYTSHSAPNDGPPPQVRAALDACIKTTGAVAPVPGKAYDQSEGKKIEEGRKKIEACMTAKGFPPPPARPEEERKIRALLDACVEETKVTRLKPGEKPSDEDRKKVDACLKNKGLNPPAPPSDQ